MIRNHIIYSDDFNFIKISDAEGPYIYDEYRKRHIDFTSGWNTASLGWRHPEIADAVAGQAKTLPHVPHWTTTEIGESYAAALVDALPKTPKRLDYIARAASGTDANEMAIRAARIFTGRTKILKFKNAYHGHTLAPETISPADANGFVNIDFPVEPGMPGFYYELDTLLHAGDIAAIICEPGVITGEGAATTALAKGRRLSPYPDNVYEYNTMTEPTPDVRRFMLTIRRLAKRYRTLVILDETSTGFSRLGKLFGMELAERQYPATITESTYGRKTDGDWPLPDMATFGKGMANGQGVLAALAMTKRIADATHDKGAFVSTLAWTPQAVAAAAKTLEIHRRDKVWEQAKENGDYIRSVLSLGLKNHLYFRAPLKGIGMIIGMEFTNPEFVKNAVKTARAAGLYIISRDNFNIQLMPPLNIERKVLDDGLSRLFWSLKVEKLK